MLRSNWSFNKKLFSFCFFTFSFLLRSIFYFTSSWRSQKSDTWNWPKVKLFQMKTLEKENFYWFLFSFLFGLVFSFSFRQPRWRWTRRKQKETKPNVSIGKLKWLLYGNPNNNSICDHNLDTSLVPIHWLTLTILFIL